MGAKRKQHSAQFKAQVVMAALAGDRTLAELASAYGVHPTMITSWKQEGERPKSGAESVKIVLQTAEREL